MPPLDICSPRLRLLVGPHRPDDGTTSSAIIVVGDVLRGRSGARQRLLTREKVGGIYPVELRDGEVMLEAEPWQRTAAQALRDMAEFLEREVTDVMGFHAVPGPIPVADSLLDMLEGHGPYVIPRWEQLDDYEAAG